MQNELLTVVHITQSNGVDLAELNLSVAFPFAEIEDVLVRDHERPALLEREAVELSEDH